MHKKFVKSLKKSIEEQISSWEKQLTEWVEGLEYPTIGDKIASQVQQLVGLGEDVSAYDWALSL